MVGTKGQNVLSSYTQRTRLKSGARGCLLPRRQIMYGDSDSADGLMWKDWFFGDNNTTIALSTLFTTFSSPDPVISGTSTLNLSVQGITFSSDGITVSGQCVLILNKLDLNTVANTVVVSGEGSIDLGVQSFTFQPGAFDISATGVVEINNQVVVLVQNAPTVTGVVNSGPSYHLIRCKFCLRRYTVYV